MGRRTDVLIALLVPCLILFHLSVAPYSKVEESFNLQATHDILKYGIPFKNVDDYLRTNYDHLTFSGSVPRTFVGPLALAAAASPFAWLVKGVQKQIFVRAILGIYNSFCILAFRNAVFKRFGSGTANWFILFQAAQFHIMFWSSRTLPNFFAFGLATLAMGAFLPRVEDPKFRTSPTALAAISAEKRALTILTFLGVVFRSEIAILLATHTASLLFHGRLMLDEVVVAGINGLMMGIFATIPIDSFFWRKFPLWPEMTGFIFNVLQGQSSDWGTEPWHYYLTSALPKLLFNPLSYLLCIPLAVLAPGLRPQSLEMLFPVLAFLQIYSLQPHKEWRFIVYVIPTLTALAARGANYIWTRRAKAFSQRLLALILALSVLASFAASFLMLGISTLNYPGAQALNAVHAIADGSRPSVVVHMDTLSCMTGITRFLELPNTRREFAPWHGQKSTWLYDKNENEGDLLLPKTWDHFSYVLAENPERAIGSWKVVHTVYGYAGLRIVRPREKLLPQDPDSSNSSEIAIIPSWSYGEGPWADVARRIAPHWHVFQVFARQYITGGWWILPRMEPKIYVLRKDPCTTCAGRAFSA